MRSTCDHIAETLAAGDALTDADERHAQQCDTCKYVLAMPQRIADASDTDGPRVGFEARATAGALERVARRRRRRIGLYGSVAAAAGAAAIAAVWIARDDPATRADHADPTPAVSSDVTPDPETPTTPTPLGDTELAELIDLSDVERSLSFAADWDDIEAPLAPLRAAAERGDDR